MYHTKNDVTLFRPPSTKLLVTCENGRQKQHNGGPVTSDRATHCARTVLESSKNRECRGKYQLTPRFSFLICY